MKIWKMHTLMVQKKNKGGDLKYDCEVENIEIKYEVLITVLSDGSVRVDDYIDKTL